MTALPTILQAKVINGVISRIKITGDTLQRALGMEPGGINTTVAPVRRSHYDIFDDTREVPTAAAPGSKSVAIARQPVGIVPYTIPTSREYVPIGIEELNQLRQMGGDQAMLDQMGEKYVAQQAKVLKRRSSNLREFQISAMLRGSYTFSQTGPDQLVHGYSGGSITVDYRIPAGNKSQLNMLGAGDIIGTAWDNAAAPIIDDLWQINAAFIELTGRGLRTMIISSTVWGFILANTQVKNTSGSVNRVFDVLERNNDNEVVRARLLAFPNLDIWINDNGLNLSGTFTKLIPATAAVFLTEQDSETAEYAEGVSPVVERDGQAPINHVGDHYWADVAKDPPAHLLHRKSDGLPFLYVPKTVAFATVDF